MQDTSQKRLMSALYNNRYSDCKAVEVSCVLILSDVGVRTHFLLHLCLPHPLFPSFCIFVCRTRTAPPCSHLQVSGLEKELIEGAAGVRVVKSNMQTRITSLEREVTELLASLRERVMCIPSLLRLSLDKLQFSLAMHTHIELQHIECKINPPQIHAVWRSGLADLACLDLIQPHLPQYVCEQRFVDCRKVLGGGGHFATACARLRKFPLLASPNDHRGKSILGKSWQQIIGYQTPPPPSPSTPEAWL